jgi:HSP20 family molecular chaperone IbpA
LYFSLLGFFRGQGYFHFQDALFAECRFHSFEVDALGQRELTAVFAVDVATIFEAFVNGVDAENVIDDLEVDFLRLEVLHVEFDSLEEKKKIANLPAQFQTTVNTEAVSVDKENGVQRVKFNVQNFKPEEIDLKVVDNILRVHAVHKSFEDGSNVHSEYSRQFTLPEGIDLEAMKSTLGEEGVLEVEIPLAPEKPKQRKIQIKML